jgi:hypothetical protein
MQQVPNNGVIRAFGLFNQEVLLAVSPEAVKEALVTNADHWVMPPAAAALCECVLEMAL